MKYTNYEHAEGRGVWAGAALIIAIPLVCVIVGMLIENIFNLLP